MNTSEKLQNYLDKYLNFEKTPQKNIFWLDTMEYFCEKFHHPEIFAPTIHVAGSKGKGSVSSMISSILDASGKKTGLYTSPHIIDFFERIGSAHGKFDESIYENATNELISTIEKIDSKDLPAERPITWFELVTLYGMLCFREAKVDVSVFEVGLGGRLDSTNVITPKISVITPIELEHTEFLGNTVEKIAYEKAGIIKKNVPVIISKQTESVKEVFRKVATEKNAPIYFVDEIVDTITFDYENDFMNVEIESKMFKRPIKTRLRMLGEVQAQNAALSALAIKIAFPKIDEKTIEMGLAASFISGRFEIINSPSIEKMFGLKTLILDGAHTVNSVNYTMQTFKNLFGEKNDATLLFGCAADKDSKDIALLFKNTFSDIYLTKPGNVKASNLQEIKESFRNANLSFIANEDFRTQIIDSLKKAGQKKTQLLVTGSFYLVSEVKKILGNY